MSHHRRRAAVRQTVGGIRFVGGKFANLAGSASTQAISLTDLLGGLAAAPREGDIVIVAFGSGTQTDRNLSITGYTELFDLYANDVRDTNFGGYYKIMTASPDTSITISATAANESIGVCIHVWRGVNTTTPMDVTATNATGTSTVIIDPPSITPTTAGAMIVVMGASGTNHGDTGAIQYSNSALFNLILAGHDGASDMDISTVIASIPWTSGAYNPAAFGIGSTIDNVNYGWCAITLALRPA